MDGMTHALLGGDRESPPAAFRFWSGDHTRRNRDALTAELRRLLADMLNHNADAWGPAVVGKLHDESERLTIENLAEWMDKGGWDAVDAGKVEPRLVKAACAAAEATGLQGGLATFVWPRPAGGEDTAPAAAVLFYDLHRADKDNPALRTRIEQYIRPRLRDMALALPEDFVLRDMLAAGRVALRLGLDALKTGLQSYDWPGLALCLTDKAGKAGNWLALLAFAWLAERREDAEASARAVPLVLQRRNLIEAPSTKARFVRFPTVLKDAGAWCGNLVPVDGDTIFAEEPDLAAAPLRVLKDETGNAVQLYEPRAWTIAHEHRLAGPRQMVLPGIVVDPQRNPDLGAFLAVTATDAAALDLTGLSVKVLLQLLALCPLDGTPARGPIENLVKLVYPDWKTRRQMPADVRRVGAAALSLLPLRVVELLRNGNLRVFPVMLCKHYDIPTKAAGKPEICLALNDTLAALATPKTGGRARWMLLNLSRMMDLDARGADRIAVALRLAAYWHTCRQKTTDGRRVFLPERADGLRVDDLLVEINAARVPDVIAGADTTRAGKVKLSEARARLADAILPDLADKGLVGTWDAPAAGDRRGSWLVKALPPADYLEACNKTARTRRAAPWPRRPRKTPPRKGG